jgi:hypothetical protein
MTDKDASINARVAAKGGTVTVEDEPVVKMCSGCSQSLPPSSFSGTQLKLKGKRKCKACIQQQQSTEAQSVSAAFPASAASPFAASSVAASASASSAAKSASAQSPCAAHSTSSADALSSSCSVCGDQRGNLRACSRCARAFCGPTCLKQHSNNGLCDAALTLPPLDGIAEEDRLTVDEFAELWPPQLELYVQLQRARHYRTQQCASPERRTHIDDLSFDASILAPLVAVYPPRLDADAVWWTPHCSEAKWNANAALRAWTRFNDVILFAGEIPLFFSDKDLPRGWGRLKYGAPFPVFRDGRLVHRLLVHAIYFFRHVDPRLLLPEVRSHVHVQSDAHGELPLYPVNKGTPLLRSFGYLSSFDRAGRRLLLPFPLVIRLPSPSLPLISSDDIICEDHRKMLLISGPDHAPVREAGLVVTCGFFDLAEGAMLTHVTAFAGWTADRFSCAVSDLCAFEANDAYREAEIERGEEPCQSCPLIGMMRVALADQWLQPKHRMFIATPRPGLETEVTELLLLEALKEEADAGDAQAQLLLDHLVEESGVSDETELIQAQLNRVEEMQQWHKSSSNCMPKQSNVLSSAQHSARQ